MIVLNANCRRIDRTMTQAPNRLRRRGRRRTGMGVAGALLATLFMSVIVTTAEAGSSPPSALNRVPWTTPISSEPKKDLEVEAVYFVEVEILGQIIKVKVTRCTQGTSGCSG